MSHVELGRIFQKSRVRIWQIASQNISDMFTSSEESLWFYAGACAAMLPQLETDSSTPQQSPITFGHHNWRERQKRLYESRVANLPNDPKNEVEGEEGIGEVEGEEGIGEVEGEEGISEEEGEEGVSEEEGVCDELAEPEIPERCSLILARTILSDIERNLRVRNKAHWRYNRKTVMFAYILRSYSSVCYEYLRKVLPFPSRQTISTYYRDIERKLEASYEERNVDYIITEYFNRHPLPSMTEKLYCSISIDAFSMSVLEKKKLIPSGAKVFDHRDDTYCILDSQKMEVDLETTLEEPTPEDLLSSRLMTTVHNNVFLVVLNPIDWQHPCVVLSAFAWTSGRANQDIVKFVVECIEKLKTYNVEVRAIASDGDPGYNVLHDSFFTLWKDLRADELIDIYDKLCEESLYDLTVFNSVFKLSALPVADPLHAIKIARSRALTKLVFMTTKIKVSELSFAIFKGETWFDDKSQLSRISDFHALSMFSPETFVKCFKNNEIAAATYLWPWLSLMLVIRTPFLSLDCRKSLLCGAFTLFQFFFNQDASKDFQGVKVSIRACKEQDGFTFFEPKYLQRVLHLIICIYKELTDGITPRIRMSSFGSHINENIIGRIRLGSHGNPEFSIIMRTVAKAELRRILQTELGVENYVRGRDNIGGTKIEPTLLNLVEGIDFQGAAKGLVKYLRSGTVDFAMTELEKICGFLANILERKDEIYPIYPPNPSANSGIMARLIKFE